MAVELVQTDNVVELIQLALAPVFLIVGIGQILNAVTGRLARIIDRARFIDQKLTAKELTANKLVRRELSSLKRRMSFANWAITFLTGAAVIICLDVVLLLLNGLIDYDLRSEIIILFMLTMLGITGGLLSFFCEVSVATATLKIETYESEDDK